MKEKKRQQVESSQFPADWQDTTFGKHIKVTGGSQPPKSSFVYEPRNGYVQLLQIRDFGNKPVPTFVPKDRVTKFCEKDDILIARYGASLGRILTGKQGAYNVALAKTIFDRDVLYPSFVEHYLRTPFFQVPLLMLSRSAQNGFSEIELSKFTLPIPPLDEQKRIVAKIEELFSELDAGEQSLRAARQQLTLYRQSLLKQAFEGKLTEAWRTANPDKLEDPETLLTRIQQERETRHQQQLQDWQRAVEEWKANGSEGKKPAKPKISEKFRLSNNAPAFVSCWAIAPIGDMQIESLIGLVRASGLQSQSRVGPRYVKMDRIDMLGNIDTSPEVFISCDEAELSRYQLREGDILFNTRNSVELVGKTGLVRSLPIDPVVYNNNLMRIRFGLYISPEFINMQMCSSLFRDQMDAVKKATTSVAAVYAKDLWPIALQIPSLPEQQEIVRLLDEQFTAIEQNEKEIDHALTQSQALRQSILKKAFSGQLCKPPTTK